RRCSASTGACSTRRSRSTALRATRQRAAKPAAGVVVRVHEATGTAKGGFDKALAAAVKSARAEVDAPIAVEIARQWADLSPRGRGPAKGSTVAEREAREAQDILAQAVIANDGEVIQRLRLSAAEAARVCNVTPRQLIYWTKKGLVKPSTNDDHDYDVFAMEKVIRIRQALEKGYSLEKAAQVVARDLAALQTEVKRLESLAPD